MPAEDNGHEDFRDEVARGLEYTHYRANTNTGKLLEVASFAYSVIEILAEKGFISIEELDERKKVVADRLAEKFRELGMGVVRTEPEVDKYTFKGGPNTDDGGPVIDCENRVHLCKAACCRLAFGLTKQDVEEGAVRWDFARPYMIARGSDGYCVHLDRGEHKCGIYERRPVPCRGYDCRQDERIWADFEARIPSPDLEKLFTEDPAETA
jgi:hypothetical protein